MGKIDFSGFDEMNKEGTILPAKVIVRDVVPTDTGTQAMVQKGNTSTVIKAAGEATKDVVSSLNPTTAIINLIDKALNLAGDIAKCVTMVSLEREHTEQTRIEAGVKIAEADEETRRKKIEEEEKTKRTIAECKVNIKNSEIELKKVKEQTKQHNRALKTEHEIFMDSLNTINKAIDSNIETKKQVMQLIIQCEDSDERARQFDNLNKIDDKLVELAKEVVHLKETVNLKRG